MQKTKNMNAPPDNPAAAAEIPIEKIRIDDADYPRAKINPAVVEEYARFMKAGSVFPAIVVFFDGENYWLADGRHRIGACLKLGKEVIRAEVHQGSRRDATLFALAANGEHGLRRTSADKRKAVTIMLEDPEWRQWADNAIARCCNVSADLVKSVRKRYERDHLPETEDGQGRMVRRGKSVFKQKSPRPEAANPRPEYLAAITEMMGLASKARCALPAGDTKLAEGLDRVGGELHEILGQATGAKCRLTEGLRVPLNVYEHELKSGITETPEFARKGLATFSVNVGLGCGHLCPYCSSRSLRCRNAAYGELQLNPFDRGFAVIDVKTPERISQHIPKLTAEDTVMLCTCDDAWSPEARLHGIGRKCLEILLRETPAQVRILTKSAEVARDFDAIKGFEKRVTVGLSTGIPWRREDVADAIEPNASPVQDRLKALKQAHDLGIRTFGMLCPCFPGVADSEEALTGMFKDVIVRGAEAIWLEPVNARGPALRNTVTALRLAGLNMEADAVAAIQNEAAWSAYATALTETALKVAQTLGALDKLRILLYRNGFNDDDRDRLMQYKDGIVWLGKDKKGKTAEAAGADEPEADAAEPAETAAGDDDDPEGAE